MNDLCSKKVDDPGEDAPSGLFVLSWIAQKLHPQKSAFPLSLKERAGVRTGLSKAL